MKFKVETINSFDRQLKRLAKKFPSLKNEMNLLADELEFNPSSGDSLGNNCYKIRIPIASKGKGKRGGGRIITCVKVVRQTVYLLCIYDKSEQPDISDNDLKFLVSKIPI
ncbi:MAG: type II toxin-antitoxin system RelE/ParE family toxin [Bacteroidia bacterium]